MPVTQQQPQIEFYVENIPDMAGLRYSITNYSNNTSFSFDLSAVESLALGTFILQQAQTQILVEERNERQ